MRPRAIWLGNLAMLLTGACLNPMWYFPTLSMQRVLGYGPLADRTRLPVAKFRWQITVELAGSYPAAVLGPAL